MSKLENRWNKIVKKEENIFIGREEFINIFEDLYVSIEQRETTLLNFYGVGGIGKSTILKQIKKKAIDSEVPVFYYDLAKHSSILGFYENLYQWFQINNIKAVYFQMAFLAYWQRLHPNVEFKDSLPTSITESGLFGDIVSVMIDDTFELAKEAAPIVGGMSKFLYKSYKKLKNNYNLDDDIVDYIGELESNELEIEEIENRLPYFLMQDLKNIDIVGQKAPLFLFDTYEKLYEFASADKRNILESWVENFVASIQQNGMVVVAGREKLEWKQYDLVWDKLITYKQLDALSYNDAKNIIEKYDIKETLVIEAIAKASKGYPFYIELAVETYKSSPEHFNSTNFKDIGLNEIFKRFVGNLNSDYLTILEYLSIPKNFNQELYVYIMHQSSIGFSDIIFKNITSFSFFSQNGNQFFMHDLMRKSFHASINDKQYKTIHKIIFNYYQQKIDINNDKKEIIDSFLIKDAIYHLLNFATDDTINEWFKLIKKRLLRNGEYSLLIDLYKNALKYIKSDSLKVRFIIDLALIHLDMDDTIGFKSDLEELEYMKIPINLLDDTLFLKTKKKLYYIPNKKRKKTLENIEKAFEKVIIKSDTIELKLRAYIELANLLRKNKKYYESQSLLYTALNIADDSFFKSKIFDKLGYLYRDMKQFDIAKDYFIKAIELKKEILSSNHIEIAKSYRGLSHILLKLNKIDECCDMKLQAIIKFVPVYGKWSNQVFFEYKAIAKYQDLEWVESQHGLDTDLFLVAKLDNLLEQNKNYSHILEKLEYIENDNTCDIYTKIAGVLIKVDHIKSKQYFLKALELSKSDIQRWKIYLTMYLTYRQETLLKEAEESLLNLLNISKNLNFERYVGDLQRAAFFYIKYIKNQDKAFEMYIKAENILKLKMSNKKKLAEIYHFLSNLYNNYEKKLYFLEKELYILKQTNAYHEQAKVMEKISKLMMSNNSFEDAQNILLNILDIYKEAEDYGRMDSTYGRLADFNNKFGNIDKALEYYYLQIETRKEIGDSFKLSRGYKFLSDFIYQTMKDEKKAEEYLNKALQIILDADNQNYELIELNSHNLLRLYIKTENFDKLKEIIDFRLEFAQKSNILQFKILAHKDLEFYYNKLYQNDKAIETAKKTLSLIPQNNHPIEKIEVLSRLIKYTSDKLDVEENILYLLNSYELNLFIGEFKRADTIFKQLLYQIKNNNIDLQIFESRYKAIFGSLLNNKKYLGYINAIKHFKSYNHKAYVSFIFDQVRRLKKRENNKSELFYKLYTQFKSIDEIFPSNVFYETYFNLRLIELKNEFDLQKELYETSLSIFEQMNKKINKAFLVRYDRFKIRMTNMWVVNGHAIDKVLFDILEKHEPLANNKLYDSIELKLNQYINSCYTDDYFMQRVDEYRLNPSVIIQGVKVLIPDYNPIRFGFETNQLFLSCILTHTPLRLVKSENNNSYLVIRRDKNIETGWKIIDDIDNYKEHVHNENNYAILLSKVFFEGKGVFFSKNKSLDQKIYKFLSSAYIVNMTFNTILELIYDNCKIEDKTDRLRASNILKNIYYADLFLVENSYEEFENRKLTLKTTGIELEKSLKQFGSNILKNWFEDINEVEYNSLWI